MQNNFDYYDAETGEGLGDSDIASAYNDYLDEMGEVEVAGLTYYTSEVLQRVDPTAYRCGRSDYVDMMLTDGVWTETPPADDDDEDEAA